MSFVPLFDLDSSTLLAQNINAHRERDRIMGTYTAGYGTALHTEIEIEFDSMWEAVRFLSATVERMWDADYATAPTSTARERADEKWLPVSEDLHLARFVDDELHVSGAGMRFWVVPTENTRLYRVA